MPKPPTRRPKPDLPTPGLHGHHRVRRGQKKTNWISGERLLLSAVHVLRDAQGTFQRLQVLAHGVSSGTAALRCLEAQVRPSKALTERRPRGKGPWYINRQPPKKPTPGSGSEVRPFHSSQRIQNSQRCGAAEASLPPSLLPPSPRWEGLVSAMLAPGRP